MKDFSTLGDSKDIALKSFYAIEGKIGKAISIKEQYVTFMNEYFSLGHMKKFPWNQVPNLQYFFPHHCVLRPNSTIIKLWVVFYASIKISCGLSLNELFPGPKKFKDLFYVLLRFRMCLYVFASDKEKMYRQVALDEKAQNFQLVLWRDYPDQTLKYF